KHVLHVVLVVPGCVPHLFAKDQGRLHLVVVASPEQPSHVVGELVEQDSAFREEKWETRCVFIENEQVQLLPEHSMVTLLGLFKSGQVLAEFRFREEGRAIHTHELFTSS